MEAAMENDDRMTSAAAFVEGGVQEACNDACSICLDEFSQSEPSTVTNCRHEFHLHCILEWCQRSSNCPMCWQPVSLKDATSQELLEAVEHERKLNANARVLQQSGHGDFGMHHLAFGATEAEFEEHIIQHLTAATAIRRGRQYVQMDGQRNRSPSHAHAHPHHPFFIFARPGTSHPTARGERSDSAGISPRSPSLRQPNSPGARELPVSYSPVRPEQIPLNRAGSNVSLASRLGFLPESRFATQASPRSQDTAGPSDLQTLSETLRSRFSDWSTRYRESFSRNTRGWKERMFAHTNSSIDFSSEGHREASSPPIGGASGSNDSASRSNMSNSDQATHSSDSKVPNCAPSSASD